MIYKKSVAPKYLGTPGAAKALGMTRAGLHLWIKQGRIRPTLTIGKQALWSQADIARLKALKKKIKTGRPKGSKVKK